MSITSSKCVLVVDDETSIRETIGDMLKMEGYRVELANDGLQALELMRTSQPDAILLDLSMPNMDGPTFLQQCRANPLCGGRPIAVMSASSKLSEIADALQVQGTLAKPFDMDVLLDTVERLLQVPIGPQLLAHPLV
jgi:CheY-like chemotaxis protein